MVVTGAAAVIGKTAPADNGSKREAREQNIAILEHTRHDATSAVVHRTPGGLSRAGDTS
jgi:hypothetical protein